VIKEAQDGDRRNRRYSKQRTHVAALVRDASLGDEPKLLDAVTAAAGFALENARLHAELHARLEEVNQVADLLERAILPAKYG
jgi:hypothetical protein